MNLMHHQQFQHQQFALHQQQLHLQLQRQKNPPQPTGVQIRQAQIQKQHQAKLLTQQQQQQQQQKDKKQDQKDQPEGEDASEPYDPNELREFKFPKPLPPQPFQVPTSAGGHAAAPCRSLSHLTSIDFAATLTCFRAVFRQSHVSLFENPLAFLTTQATIIGEGSLPFLSMTPEGQCESLELPVVSIRPLMDPNVTLHLYTPKLGPPTEGEGSMKRPKPGVIPFTESAKVGGVCVEVKEFLKDLLSALGRVPVSFVVADAAGRGVCRTIMAEGYFTTFEENLAHSTWLVPVPVPTAVVVSDEKSDHFLSAFLVALREVPLIKCKYPRDKVTVEPWDTRGARAAKSTTKRPKPHGGE